MVTLGEGCWAVFLRINRLGIITDLSLQDLCQYGSKNSSRVKLSYILPIIILRKGCERDFLTGGEVKDILTYTLVDEV